MSRVEGFIVFLLFVLIWIVLEKNPEKTGPALDNQSIEVKMEGSWKRFGKLNFNDRIWTDE